MKTRAPYHSICPLKAREEIDDNNEKIHKIKQIKSNRQRLGLGLVYFHSLTHTYAHTHAHAHTLQPTTPWMKTYGVIVVVVVVVNSQPGCIKHK